MDMEVENTNFKNFFKGWMDLRKIYNTKSEEESSYGNRILYNPINKDKFNEFIEKYYKLNNYIVII